MKKIGWIIIPLFYVLIFVLAILVGSIFKDTNFGNQIFVGIILTAIGICFIYTAMAFKRIPAGYTAAIETMDRRSGFIGEGWHFLIPGIIKCKHLVPTGLRQRAQTYNVYILGVPIETDIEERSRVVDPEKFVYEIVSEFELNNIDRLKILNAHIKSKVEEHAKELILDDLKQRCNITKEIPIKIVDEISNTTKELYGVRIEYLFMRMNIEEELRRKLLRRQEAIEDLKIDDFVAPIQERLVNLVVGAESKAEVEAFTQRLKALSEKTHPEVAANLATFIEAAKSVKNDQEEEVKSSKIKSMLEDLSQEAKKTINKALEEADGSPKKRLMENSGGDNENG